MICGMSDMSAAEHLRLGREALARQRQGIDAAIAAIDKVLADLEQTPAAMTEVVPTAPTPSKAAPELATRVVTDGPVPTVREGILRVLREAGRPLKTMDIIVGVSTLGIVAHDDSVRSILIKMMKQGAVRRVGHGVYALPPENAETPVLTGVSVVSAPVRKEVTNNGTTFMDDQDPAWQADDPDSRSGAPVSEGQGLVAL